MKLVLVKSVPWVVLALKAADAVVIVAAVAAVAVADAVVIVANLATNPNFVPQRATLTGSAFFCAFFVRQAGAMEDTPLGYCPCCSEQPS